MSGRKKRSRSVMQDCEKYESSASQRAHLDRSAPSTSYGLPMSAGSSRHVRQRSSSCDKLQQPTYLYIDNGDCDRICEFCNALFWFDERLISSSANHSPKYTQCCRGGQVVLPYPKQPNGQIVELFKNDHFLTNIRLYNSIFSMTSFGAKIDDTINNGTAPYVFKIEGQIHHYLGSLCPPSNEKPRFLQMYIYDTENELSNRLRIFTSESEPSLKQEMVLLLMNVFDASNELVKLFRSAREICSLSNVPEFSICLYSSYNAHSYDTPSPGSIGAILPDMDYSCTGFDIIIHNKEGQPQ